MTMIVGLYPVNRYLLKVNNRNNRCHLRHSGVFITRISIVNFEHV